MGLRVDYELTIDQLPQECIADCSHSGSCDADVAYWIDKLEFTVNRGKAIEYLAGYGAWEREEMAKEDDDTIAGRILWLACGNFSEWDGTEDSNNGSDIFILE